MKCAIFEEHSSSCVVNFRFSGTLFPVSMMDGEEVNYFPAGNHEASIDRQVSMTNMINNNKKDPKRCTALERSVTKKKY